MQDVVKKPSRRSQAERSAATSASLIAATITSLYEKGYAATSTTQVAQLAGVSRGAMLHHYPTKVHLMAATVYATYASDISAYQAVSVVDGEQNDYLDRLIDTAWSCFRSPSGIAQTEIWMATRSDVDLASAVLPVHAAIVGQSVQALKSVLHDRVADKTLKADYILTYLVSTLRGLSLQHVLGSPDEELRSGVKMLKSTIGGLLEPVAR
jgi:AcrR family transcriptional regulator